MKSPGFLLGCRLADALNVDPLYLALGGRAVGRDRLDDLERRLAAVEQALNERR